MSETIKILVIDDDFALANAIKLVLENEGYDIEIAGDSKTAIEMIQQREYDILLCDYNLPDMNGLELIKKALQISSRSVPILITGISSMDLAFDGMRLGVHDYLVKPIDYDELRKIIIGIIDERNKFEKGKEKLKEQGFSEKPEPEKQEETIEEEILDRDADDPEKSAREGSQTDNVTDSPIEKASDEEVSDKAESGIPGSKEEAEKKDEIADDDKDLTVEIDKAAIVKKGKVEEGIEEEKEEEPEIKPVETVNEQPEPEKEKPAVPAENELTQKQMKSNMYESVSPGIELDEEKKNISQNDSVQPEKEPVQIHEEIAKIQKEPELPDLEEEEPKYDVSPGQEPEVHEPDLSSKDDPAPRSPYEYRRELAQTAIPEDIGQDEEKERTIFDFVLDRSSRLHKIIRNTFILSIFFSIVFIALDSVFFQFTKVGINLHNKFWPPAIILDSIPSQSLVSLKNSNGEEIIQGNMYNPVSIPKILPGKYELTMTLEGFNPIKRVITVYGNQKKISDIAVPGSIKKAGIKNQPQKHVLLFEISVRIDSVPPGAVVYVDTKRIGLITPCTLDLSAGLHTILLEKSGFTSLGNLERYETYGQCNLDLSKKQQLSIDTRFWKFEKTLNGIHLKGTFWKELKINSSPSRAKLLINGELLGLTPANIKLTVGEHRLTIKKDGYVDWDSKILIPDKDEVSASLSKIVLLTAFDEDVPGKDLGASVSINGRLLRGKKTPFTYIFKQGSYKIAFSKAPHFIRWSKSIKVKSQNKIIARLQRKKFFVEIIVKDETNDSFISAVQVKVDGDLLGVTDENGLWKGSLKGGQREIGFLKPLYIEKIIIKDISSQEKFIKINLERDADAPIDMDIDKSAPVKMEKSKKSVKKEKRNKQYCTVIIDSRPHFPGAGIYFDGKYKGDTVRRITNVSLGKHKIVIKHPYIGKITNEIELNEPDKKVIISFSNTGEVKIR